MENFRKNIAYRIFEKSDGTKISLHNGSSNSKNLDTHKFLIVKGQCKKGESWHNSVSQSSLSEICNSEALTLGVYKVCSYYPNANI